MKRIKYLYLFLFETGQEKPEPGDFEGYFAHCADDIEAQVAYEELQKGPAKDQVFIRVEKHPYGYQLATREIPGALEVEEKE